MTWSRKRRHGLSDTPIYNIWRSMKARCLNPKDRLYQWYGARGIRVCERWMVFENFLIDMGPRPDGFSVERKDNSGNYEPENCVWATRIEQGANKRNNRRLTLNGVTRTLAEWARETGISADTIAARIKLGWVPERALTTVVGATKPSGGWDTRRRNSNA